jgi:hypothetical protein
MAQGENAPKELPQLRCAGRKNAELERDEVSKSLNRADFIVRAGKREANSMLMIY